MAMIVVDTDVLIDVSHGVEEAINCIENAKRQATLAISAITEMELVVGCRDKIELRKLEKFLQLFAILAVKETISSQAVRLLRQYRLSHGLLIPDALIAATTLDYGVALISKNQRDFRFITDLNLLPYP
ncbi:MAG: type II toxin-antitoxin system VapC family toxin [Blastocatellia bacterium]